MVFRAWISASAAMLLLGACAGTPPAAGSRERGEVPPVQASEVGSASRLQCGPLIVVISPGAAAMRMQVATASFELRPVPTAMGAKYVAVNDPTTRFWSKGDIALVEIRGKPYPECHPLGATDTAFRAGGNEPGWRLEIDEQTLSLIVDEGRRRLDGATPAVVMDGAVKRYRTEAGGKDLAVMVEERMCADTMSGMPHPVTVEVVYNGRKLSGCGGDPADLLRGAEWVVEDLAGSGLIERSRVTLEFGADGRVAGASSCNNYHGDYALSGEGLAISRLAGTLRACASALMEQEKAFLEVLTRVTRFEIAADGALVLHGADQRSIRARRD